MTAAAIELREVRKSFGRTEIINGVSLSIAQGERHAIIGPNGAGKSTLFNLVSGRYQPSSGSILLDGEDVTGLKPFQINRKGLSRSFQVTNIFHNLSVYENIRCGVLWASGFKYSFWHRVAGLREVRRRSEEVMERIGLAARRYVPAGTLSYPAQRALGIGITHPGGASALLPREPSAGPSRACRWRRGNLSTPLAAMGHKWRVGDLVMWDNLATMHRGTAFDDKAYRERMAESDFPGETFRVLKQKEEKLHCEYRTRRLVLEAWDRIERRR